MATTAKAIRDAMLALVENITPDDQSAVPFRAHRESSTFRDWAEANPQACLRRFSIRSTGAVTPPSVTNTDVEWLETDIEVTIAYPSGGRFGAHALTSLDDAIENDLREVERYIGTNGYAAYAQQTAGATVTTTDTDRDVSGPVTFATLRLHAGFYRVMGTTNPAPQIYSSTTGAKYAAGDIVTGEAALRALVMDSGVVRYKYEKPLVGSEPAGGHLHILDSDGVTWTRAMATQYGDWAFFAAPNLFTADRAIIIEASDDAVEMALVWDVLQLNQAYLNNLGIVYRDFNDGLIYPDTSNVFRYLASTKLTKVVRLERGADGYFVGWHSDPHIGPPMSKLTGVGSLDNNEPAWGERELGTGGGTAVAWSSNGGTAYFPAWSTRAVWATAEAAYGGPIGERHWWNGHDDPTYGVMANAAFIPTQDAGFPKQQAAGPYYLGDIPATDFVDAVTTRICRFIVTLKPIEGGVWQFSTTGRGSMVEHFCNNWATPSGVPYRFQIYIGAFPYQADTASVAVTGYSGVVEYGNEPKAGVRAIIANRAAAVTAAWPT